MDLNKVPIVEIDKDGEVVTGFLAADNYFELYINGKLIGVDATPYTPFNSHVVRFRVKRPYTIAVLAQDWEDKLGLGVEMFQGNPGIPAMGASWRGSRTARHGVKNGQNATQKFATNRDRAGVLGLGAAARRTG